MVINPSDITIGFVGLGRMGAEIARLFIDKGYSTIVNNRHKKTVGPVLADGAQWVDTYGELAKQSDVIITMLGFPEDVEDVYLGDDSLIENARPGTYLIDMTTSSPKLSHVISTMAAVNDLHAIDAPISGDEMEARRGNLVIMVGGEKDDFEALLPILKVMGSKISYVGEAGYGMLMKLATTIAFAGAFMGTVEAISLAKAAGLDANQLLMVAHGSNADSWALSALGPKILNDELDDGIRVKHFCKDLGMSLQIAKSYELTLPGLDVANSLFNLLYTAGGAEMATQALYLIYCDEDTCFEHGLNWDAANDENDYDDEGTDGPSRGYAYHRCQHKGLQAGEAG